MFCSTPDCEVIIKMKGADRFGIEKFGLEINCECGQSLCTSCGNAWHDPVSFDLNLIFGFKILNRFNVSFF